MGLEQCLELVAKCKPSTRAWMTDYFEASAEEYGKLPVCKDIDVWKEEHYGPAIRRVAARFDMMPMDEDCALMGRGMTYSAGGAGSFHAGETGSDQSEAPAMTVDPEPARIDRDEFLFQPDAGPPRRFHVSALATIGGYNGFTFAFGGLIGVPILDSVVNELNDALYLEAGARFGFVDYLNSVNGTFLQILLGARWDFHFTKELSAYAAARLTPAISFDFVPGRFAVGAAVGGHWRFIEAMALRVELDGSNYGGSVTGGVTFFF